MCSSHQTFCHKVYTECLSFPPQKVCTICFHLKQRKNTNTKIKDSYDGIRSASDGHRP